MRVGQREFGEFEVFLGGAPLGNWRMVGRR